MTSSPTKFDAGDSPMRLSDAVIEIFAEETGLPRERFLPEARLDELLQLAHPANADPAMVAPAAGTLRPSELNWLLLTMSIEDRLGCDLTAHPDFDRLLNRTLAELIAAVESLAAREERGRPPASGGA